MTPARSKSTPGLSILVVEDEVLIALEIEDRLKRMGFGIAGVVDSGEMAIRSAQASLPDLVLMDIRLKGKMDGIEAAGQIRRLLNIPVVYLTAHSDHETLQRVKETAAFGYVIKPFDEKALQVGIEMAVNRHLLEKRVKESEQKYVATLNSIGDGVAATDAAGQITYINRVAEALTGWNFSDAEGRAVEDVFSVVREAGRTVMENPARRALREQTVVLLAEPALLVSRQSDFIPIDDSAAPIRNDRGNIIGAVIAFRDIRERRLTEDALRNAEEQLRQSRKMEAIGRLAAGVSHDFNNLLTVINGYSDLVVEDGNLDALSMWRIREVRKAGERAALLTSQLLAFSRKQMLRPEVLDLNLQVRAMLGLLQRLIGEDIILDSFLGKDLPVIEVDPTQLEQVIMNLAVNSRDAMPEGGRLTIETASVQFESNVDRPEIKPGRYVMLSVRDTGAGFADGVKENLFEPFFTTKEVGKGTGLGLATVYGIVKQSQGFIDVESELGAGATFRICFPASDAKIVRPLEQMPVQVGPLAKTMETILLVEDEEGVRVMSSAILRKLGYTVLEASDGQQALEVMRDFTGTVNLLVCDVVMPRMGGPALVQRMASLRPGVPVLYFSGYSDQAMHQQGILDTKASFLNKPFSPSALAEKVRQILHAPSTLTQAS